MIRKVIDAYRASFTGLSRETWLLSLVILVNRCGYMAVPFMSMYITQSLHRSIEDAGLIITLFGVGSVLGAMAGVSKDIPENSRMFGAPAAPERDQKILLATLTKLPEMRHQLKDLSRAVAKLEAAAAGGAVHEPHALSGPHQANGNGHGNGHSMAATADEEPATD